MSYADVEIKVVQWGEARGIVQNATAMSQAVKPLEETTELLAAINKKDIEETKDAIGDIVVTLIMVCAVLDLDLVQCLKGASKTAKGTSQKKACSSKKCDTIVAHQPSKE